MLAQGRGEKALSRKEAPGWGALVSLPGRARDSGLFGEQAGPSPGGSGVPAARPVMSPVMEAGWGYSGCTWGLKQSGPVF